MKPCLPCRPVRRVCLRAAAVCPGFLLHVPAAWRDAAPRPGVGGHARAGSPGPAQPPAPGPAIRSRCRAGTAQVHRTTAACRASTADRASPSRAGQRQHRRRRATPPSPPRAAGRRRPARSRRPHAAAADRATCRAAASTTGARPRDRARLPLPPPVRLVFEDGKTDLTPADEAAIQDLARAIPAPAADSVNVLAYAAGKPDDPSTARRLSLSRGLAVRSVLLASGVPSAADLRARAGLRPRRTDRRTGSS